MSDNQAHKRRRAETARQKLIDAGLPWEKAWGTWINHLAELSQLEEPWRILDAWWMARTLADLRGPGAPTRAEIAQAIAAAAHAAYPHLNPQDASQKQPAHTQKNPTYPSGDSQAMSRTLLCTAKTHRRRSETNGGTLCVLRVGRGLNGSPAPKGMDG